MSPPALGCESMCLCFGARKKDSNINVLSKEPTPVDSMSSMEMNSAFERFPGSPQRMPPSPYRVPPSPSRFSVSPKISRTGSVPLNLNQVRRGTQNFSSSFRIGSGGFGDVYKVKLSDGSFVAVKRAFKKENIEILQGEFKTEVELLAKTDHRNLVKLLGYIEEGDERLIITEYVPNGNLREHLDGLKPKILNFFQRLEIAIDVAHALTYLHSYTEKQIIHRDIKSSNVLLTDSLRAKVADFGFARVGGDSSYVHTKVRGTMGYLDPEYMKTNRLTSKSDVYSFGILLLEILTGRRPLELGHQSEERVTIKWAFNKYKDGRTVEMLDPRLNETVHKDILLKAFGLVIECAAPTQADRPTMKTVAELLWGIRIDYLKAKGKPDSKDVNR